MSYMIEIYYRLPPDHARETQYTALLRPMGGHLDFREETNIPGVSTSVCLTYEYAYIEQAEEAAAMLRAAGQYVEGPHAYGEEPNADTEPTR